MGLLALSLLSACSSARAATLGALPDGWFVANTNNLTGITSDSYTIGIDNGVRYAGHPSAYIGSKSSAAASSSGTFMQTFSARSYLGKRVRFSASVKTRDARFVGLWMRVDDSMTSVRFDNMRNRPIVGTTNWTAYSVVLGVPENAVSISFGLLEVGTGEAWLNGVTFGTTDAPTTDTIGPSSLASEPRNLTF